LAQSLNKNGKVETSTGSGEVVRAGNPTLGNLSVNGNINVRGSATVSSVKNLGTTFLNTVERDISALNNYNVSNVGILITTRT